MNARTRQAASQGLVGLNMFVLFNLAFADKLVLPAWVQTLGRMHLVLLHFPLVILGVSIWMEVHRTFGKNDTASFSRFAPSLLLIGAWLSGITVVMGLFLSREEGYAGEALQLHQWSGAVLFLMASAACRMVGRRWYDRRIAAASACVLSVLLFMTGHYGGTLTHGEDFLLKPLTGQGGKRPVPMDQAVVFADVIQPILERKCVGCHNTGKSKGGLSLADSLGLLKGGKSGALFMPGNSAVSLMMERIHLPPDQEKHMPPEGNSQLTETEIALLSLWIDHEVGFHRRLVSLPEDDSIRTMAAGMFTTVIDSSLIFDFPAADEKTIARLNSEDVNISRLSKESPALEVGIYRRAGYSVRQLEELRDIKRQTVSLKLNKLPVSDEDMKIVGGFVNIRRLDLNFTDITDRSLGTVSSLKALRSLSLSGTKVTHAGLKRALADCRKLETVTLWNTGLSAEEVADLSASYATIRFIGGAGNGGSKMLKLNPPQVRNGTLVFRDSVEVELGHPVRGVEIRYTLDGSEPDSLQSPVFGKKLTIARHTKVVAKAYKEGWHSSESIQTDFLKNSFIPDSVHLLHPLNSVHMAEGAKTFFDTRLGVFGANNPAWANYWAGARKNDLALMCFFNRPVDLSAFGLHYMVEEETGIHPPGLIEIWGGEDAGHLKRISMIKPGIPKKQERLLKTAEAAFKTVRVSCLMIVAKPPVDPKSGNPRLILIDEMFLN